MFIRRSTHRQAIATIYRNIDLLVDENIILIEENEKLKKENFKLKNADGIKAVKKATKTPPTKRTVKKEAK